MKFLGEKAIAEIAIFCVAESDNHIGGMLKFWNCGGWIAMQDKHLDIWPFHIFFWQETNPSTLNKAFIKKHLGKTSSKTSFVGIRNKIFLTATPRKCQKYTINWWSNQTLFDHCHNAKII